MGLAYVIGPHVAVVAGRPDDLQKEWQECRSIIGRLDTTLVDLRKYGFGLASGLLTANGVLGGVTNFFRGVTVPSAVSAALVAVTMVLVTVLFVVDRYYSMLQWGAVNRARGLESALSLNVTSEMLRWAQGPVALESKSGPVKAVKWLWQRVALVQYGSFVIVAAVLGATIMARDAIPSTLMWLVCMVSIVLIGLLGRSGRRWRKSRQGLSRPLVHLGASW